MDAPDTPHADRLARGALLLQGAQIVRLVGGLGVLTLLARKLSLSELGLYALLLSLITYVQFVKASVMNAAVLGVAEAGDDQKRLSTTVSTGLVVYVGVGVVSGLLLFGVGLAALPILNIPDSLEGSARAGVAGLAVATVLGWPVQIFDDLLRGQQRFAAVSALEITAVVLYVGGAVLLVVLDAPVWALVTLTASIPLATGLCCFAALPRLGIRLELGRANVDRGEMRRFASVSGQLGVSGVADLATYSVDRAILAANRSTAVVGLYEGPLQAQSMIRYLNGVLSAPVVPTARSFVSRGEMHLMRELFLKGMRYTLAVTLPLVVALVCLAGPVIVTWLGPKFAEVDTEVAVFCSFWFFGVNGGLIGTVLIATGRLRAVVTASWLTAAVNLTLALALTPEYGIWGPIVAAIAAQTIGLLYQMPIALHESSATLRDVVRQAWIPGYVTAAVVAAALVGLDLAVDIGSGPEAIAAAAGGALLYWAIYYFVWFSPDERQLARRTLRIRPLRPSR
jgi:O-antigen/teichoic acid export membrane protein